MTKKLKAAIIGSGNIGTDLMIKIMRRGKNVEMAALAGIDAASEGLARANRLGVATTAGGLEGLRKLNCYPEIDVIFDATSASAHLKHAPAIAKDGKLLIDLTPAAIGPYVIPSVNIDQNIGEGNVNMVTCGGQATIPIVAAISRVTRVHYAEIVASIASKSAGPGTRANIDEFTETTANAIEAVGGAAAGKAIIILNPAEPPVMMRDTVFCLVSECDQDKIRASIKTMVDEIQSYVPGYRLKQEVQFSKLTKPVRVGKTGELVDGFKVSVFLEVEGAAHYLPAYAGNLDIMTSAALRTAEHFAERSQVKAA